MSDVCWMSKIIDCQWNHLNTGNDLMTLAEGGTGWRSALPGGGGKNFKADDTSLIYRADRLTLGDTPSIAIVPAATGGKMGASKHADITFATRYECRIYAPNLLKVMKFSCLMLFNILTGYEKMFQDPDNGFTNLIQNMIVPTINFEDYTLYQNDLWAFSIPLVMELSINLASYI